nr:phospholipid-transporting ATPase ABCA3 [Parasteatoda tepidariorum]
MKMMGMTDTVYWISTFLNYFIVGLLTVFSITIIYKSPLKTGFVFLANTDFFLIFLILLLYIISVILFCMTFTIFFNRAVFAIIAFIILWDTSFNLLMQKYFLMNIQTNYFDLSLSAKLAMCLLPTGSLLTVFGMISVQKQWGDGFSWSNITDYAISPDINMAMVLGMMVLSCCLYTFMLWYFDKVWPWQPGVPQPFYFMFTKSYWCGVKPEFDDLDAMKGKDQDEEYFEEEPTGISRGVEIRNLSKGFQVNFQTKMAVKNLSLNIYQGQITALLGHNGAGKTTTINILTGLYTPSSGSASINGVDILSDTHGARRGLGVCPQHNVLFDTLTVDEHLKIFAGLKGVPWRNLASEALKVLEILKFTDKRYELVKNLSGGMKRKLSLGNAIVGGSNVLFLDEPTSGMDVEARRSVWDSLLNIRQERTIILTTHYMEEADILGDRIAIMAEGEVQCCGSPIFLKKKFGTGYHLHMVKNPDFKVEQINDMLTRYLPEIKVTKELENEITYNLPSNSGVVLGEMFEELENGKEKLGVNSCGITVTTMEDVFLKVSNMSDIKYTKKGERSLQNGVSFEYEDVYGSARQLSMNKSLTNQFFALLEKRFHYTKRHWSILINQLIVPFLFICFCFTSIKGIQNQFNENFDPIKLDVTSVYGNTDGFYYSHTTNYTDVVHKVDRVLKANNVDDPEVKNPTHYVLDTGKLDLTRYLKKMMVGASVDELSNGTLNLTAWYNGEPYHALPMSLLLAHTALLKQVSSDEATISLTNAPLSRYRDQINTGNFGMEGTMAGVFITIAFGFVSACAVLVPIHERTTKAQLLQLMTGIPNVLYWLSMFLWDFILVFIVSIILIIPFAIFYNYVFFGQHSEAILNVLLVFWLYGFASTPLSYLVSLVFKKGNTGFSIVAGMSVILGVALSSILSAVYGITTGSTQDIVGIFIWIARIFPFYSLASSITNLFNIAFKNAFCEGISPEDLDYNCNADNIGPENALFKCCKKICGSDCLNQTSYLVWDRQAIGRDVTFLVIDGLLYFTLLLVIQNNLFQKFWRHITMNLRRKTAGQVFQSDSIDDSGVIEEENRVHNLISTHGSIGTEALVTMDLSKVFRNFYAVERLSLGIHQEECFGLLGVNGAGKTTTFRMLTGDCNPTSGNALTIHTSLLADTQKFQSFLGYCPQFDALIDRLTGRETLILYGRLRGLTGEALTDTVNKLIRMTDLSDHADKQTSFYSGGNKRKLSVGIALIGSPPLILLDEPTAGVDPVSRRKIWNILAQARSFTKAAVILTTHSMEESEALCSRLAIMVNGRFRCLGSIQQLKAKFGQGYTLIIKMRKETSENPESVSAIKVFIGNRLRGAELKDDHQGMLQYHVTDPSVRLSQLFKLMEEMKSQFNLEDYIISDTSLEQIFLTFARAQRVVE